MSPPSVNCSGGGARIEGRTASATTTTRPSLAWGMLDDSVFAISCESVRSTGNGCRDCLAIFKSRAFDLALLALGFATPATFQFHECRHFLPRSARCPELDCLELGRTRSIDHFVHHSSVY